MSSLKDDIQKIIKGDVSDSEEVREEYSEDKSIFKIKPQLVVFPKSSEDVKKLVRFAQRTGLLSLTARSGGTDMSGGPLTESILLVFTKYFNHIKEIGKDYAIVEPGVYYRDFEKEILKKGLLLPSYPASKEICALGGMIANNSGGEKSLKYGKTEKYVLGLKVILSDGNEYYFEKLSAEEVKEKMKLKTFEGELYRKVYSLIKDNIDVVIRSEPKVLKNSSGYNIWGLYDSHDGSFDLTKLFVGSQGTLGIITEIKVKLVPKAGHSRLLVIFVKNLKELPKFGNDVLRLNPDSLEITDDHTFKLYLRFAREMASLLGAGGIWGTFKLFLPEFLMVLRGGIPKLVVLAEFEGDDENEILVRVRKAEELVKKYEFTGRLTKTKLEEDKYWRLRRDTYRLLREKIKNRVAAPFIDDVIIRPEHLPEFLPKLYQILDEYKLVYTISGHLGEGNLHVIPLLNFKADEEKKIPEITDKVTDLVLKYGGLLSAEHNDGLIRGPYLRKEFGDDVFGIFMEIKKFFDPQGIFNPHKKVTATRDYSFAHIMD